jgi:hypothetical protein
MKFTSKLGAAALTATLLVGGTSAAFAAGSDGSGASAGKQAKITALCQHKDEILKHITERDAHVKARITKLNTLHDKAVNADKTEVATRIEKRIAHLQATLVKVDTRLQKTTTRLADCPSP